MKKKYKTTLKQLQKYCEEHDIFVPNKKSRKQLEAAIYRTKMHLQEAELDDCGCFGSWEDADVNCRFCEYENDCFEASLGCNKKSYENSIKRIDNPKLRFSKPMAKKERRKK